MTRTTRTSSIRPLPPAPQHTWARVGGALLALLALSACTTPDDGLGLTGAGLATPFPSSLHLDDEGFVDLARAELPDVNGAELPVERSRWRTGFSPAQLFVVRLDGVDAQALPAWRTPDPATASVFLVDLGTGRRLPALAELDAWPDQPDPALLVRPLRGLEPGHQVAVVITTRAAPRPERFDVLARGKGPTDLSDATRDLLDALEQDAGVDPDTVALAWSVPIEDGLRPTRSALEQADAGDVSWTFESVRTGDQADDLAWRSAAGTLTVTGVLGQDGRLALDTATGQVSRTGTWQTDLFVHIPQGVQDAPAGSVPVVIFGHGIFGSPDRYFDGRSGQAVPSIAQQGGVILIGVPWRGLSRTDLGLASGVAGDITRMPELTGALAQSQVSIRQLAQALRSGDLLDDPVFQGASGQSLPDRSRLDYFGISLGGIEGALFAGLGGPVDHAVLHVPGSMWSTMLERSSNFTVLEGPLVSRVPDPWDRQRLYAWTQLHWDQADPMGAAVTWPDDAPPILLQESLHDEQVPNLTTRALARTLDLPAVGPVVEPAWDLQSLDAPTSPGVSAWVQHDPDKPPPDDANRPAEVTRAHDTPRDWPGVQTQVLEFLERGVVVHPCGSAPCTPDNTGE